MREVIGGCKLCGKRMLTNASPRLRQTCASCKGKQRGEQRRRLAARRKAERHEFKEDMKPPRCQQCGGIIEDAKRLTVPVRPRWSRRYVEPQWARKYCGNTCRQAAFRARNA